MESVALHQDQVTENEVERVRCWQVARILQSVDAVSWWPEKPR